MRRSWAGAALTLLLSQAAGCATAPPAPTPAPAPVTQPPFDPEAARSAAFEPLTSAEVASILAAQPAGPADVPLRRALMTTPRVAFRLVAPRSEHPALDVVLARARELVAMGEPAAQVDPAPLERALATLPPLREALAEVTSPEGVARARQALRAEAAKVEVLGWRLTYEVALTLAGGAASDAALQQLPDALRAAPEVALTRYEPQEPDYRAIVAGWRRYRTLAERSPDAPPIGDGPRWRRLAPRSQGPEVAALRTRLGVEGFGAPPLDRADRFDEPLRLALVEFQRFHGLDPTGRLSPATLAALRTSLAERAEQLASVASYLRRRPARALATRLEVNIPAYELRVVRDGAVVARHKVVVGSTRLDTDLKGRRGRINQTPTLISAIHELVLNPSWRVPRRIKELELDVQAQSRPDLYDDYELYVDRQGVEWAVQRPGPGNALGRVKFVFPGGDGVFLHDTPQKKAFGKPYRALSHGCVRVERALDLARHLLEADAHPLAWDQAVAIVARRAETAVTLRQPVPVVIEYMTAGATEDGRLRLYHDVYGQGPVVPAVAVAP